MRQIAYVSPSGRTSTLVYVDQVAAAAQEEQFRAQFGPDRNVEVYGRSPNGQYIALSVGLKPPAGLGDMGLPPGDLVIVDNDGRVVGGMPGSYFLNWTSDEQGFFFVAGMENGPLELAYLDGRPGRVFTGTYDIGEVAMSPDGRTIVYTEREYRREGLWRINVEGGEPVQVFAGDDLGEPVWSPDGNWVAFDHYRESLLWLMNFATGEILTVEIGGDRSVWSPDSRMLARQASRVTKHISREGGVIYLIDPQTGQVHEVRLPPIEEIGYYSDLTWSPDGLQLAFILYSEPDADGRRTSDIWVINVDGSGLRRLTGDGRPKSNLRWIP